MVAATASTPRLHRWVQKSSKNDPENNLPASSRTTVVACICIEIAEGPDRQKFMQQLAVTPFCPCIVPCPFQHIKNYVDHIPDPYGNEAKIAEQSGNIVKTELKNPDNTFKQHNFFRALTTRGQPDRMFTLNNLGKK
jgi:hypothetical protein